MISDGQLMGSNDGSSWENIYSFYGLTWPTSTWQYLNFTNSKNYKYIALVVTKLAGNGGYVNIGELKFFGTPAPSSLEDGHLTLGKALTLPRVSGHPAGAETPRAESLVVHYDTTVDSVVSGSTVVDVSGNGINGTLTNGAAYSSTDRSFTFDGTDDYIEGRLNNTGDFDFSVSLWVKRSSTDTLDEVFFMGEVSSGSGAGLQFKAISDGSLFFYSYSGPEIDYTTGGNEADSNWVHLVAVRVGGDRKLYFNGEYIPLSIGGGSNQLSFGSNVTFRLGARTNNDRPLNGSISNFKLWDVALTAEEVAMEYALGRTGKSLNLTDTALCLGGTVPRAQLDVRGSARFDNRVDIGTNTGTSDFNPTALTIHELSNSKTTPALTLEPRAV
jgi:hypothetical protein